MKTKAKRMMLMFGLLLTLTALSVQAQTGSRLVVHVPFDFQVNNELFVAGTYAFEQATGSSVVAIRKTDGRRSTKVLTNSTRAGAPEEARPSIVFNHYADQFFLAAIYDGSGAGRAVRQSANERSFIRELAGNGVESKPQRVEVAILLK
jgi:hypothetical protein